MTKIVYGDNILNSSPTFKMILKLSDFFIIIKPSQSWEKTDSYTYRSGLLFNECSIPTAWFT